MERIIDAADCIVGRVAAQAAKSALMGDTIHILNCEKAIVSGNKVSVFARSDQAFKRTGQPTKGPFMQRRCDRYVRRIVTRMLPRARARGQDAERRVLCYIGVPKAFEGKKVESIEGSHKSKLPSYRFVTIAQICARGGLS